MRPLLEFCCELRSGPKVTGEVNGWLERLGLKDWTSRKQEGATGRRDFLRGLLDRTGSATSLHGPVVGGVILYVTRLAVSLCLAVPMFGAAADVSALLKAVQDRYNRARTVQVLFQQTYRMPGRALKTESGELSLRKPGRMRWQYESPQGKLFISDGKQMFLFTPDSNRVQRMKVRESDDLRAPLGFLLGKLDFWRDFQRFVSRPEGADLRLTAVPKSEQAPYTDVEFVVTPAYQIRYLRVMGQDGSVMEFSFSDERLNPRLAESLFRFTPPPGVEVVEGVGEGGEEP